jgi:hypothetical protein
LRTRFAPDAAAMPDVTILQPSLAAYDDIATVRQADVA